VANVAEPEDELGLDWDMPPYPPAEATNDSRPLRVDVDVGKKSPD